MFEKIIGEKIFCGLDVGSDRIKASVVRVRNSDHFELAGVFETPTRGYKKAAVSDIGDLSECIAATIGGLSSKTGIKIKDVQLGISGGPVECRRSNTVIPLLDKGTKMIIPSDVKRVIAQAKALGTRMDEDILHDFPQFYRIDDINMATNPVGLHGRKLEIDLMLLVVHLLKLENQIKAVHQAGFDIGGMFFSSLAASEASLSPQAKKDGCVLIDIGSTVTDILIFKDGILRNLETIHLGGDHVTRSVSQQLNLSWELAEDLKKSYGMALNASKENDEEILVKNETGYLPIKREVIYRSIAPEINKLVCAIEESVKGPFYSQLQEGITIVGGGSLLPGLLERIEKHTDLPVSMGKINFATLQLNNAAIFNACVGLAQMGFTKTFAYTLSTASHSSWLRGMSGRLRELYQEYF